MRSLRSKFPVSEAIWNEYHIDQEINDRGVSLDINLVYQTIRMDARSRKELTKEMQKLTNLDNPNSVQRMKQWRAENGLKADTLCKKAVNELIKEAPDELKKILLLRQQLAKLSVKKYQAMETLV